MMRLYPVVLTKGQSYKGVKVITVPDQSMSLQEIIRRFTRKEALPIEHDGVYETRFGDLEKVQYMDIVDRMERVNEIGEAVKLYNKRVKDKVDADKKELDERRQREAQAPPLSLPA